MGRATASIPPPNTVRLYETQYNNKRIKKKKRQNEHKHKKAACDLVRTDYVSILDAMYSELLRLFKGMLIRHIN